MGTIWWSMTVPGIYFGDDGVNHAAAVGDGSGLISVESPFDGVGSGELARQSGVKVDDFVWEGVNEGGAEDVHPASEDDEIGVVRV